MPDDVLRVTTVVDLSGLTTGFPNGASVIEASTARMNSAFGSVTSTVTQMDARLQATAASFTKEAAGARVAQTQIETLQQQITVLNAKLDELEAKLANAPKKASSEFTEARHAIRGLGEEIGIHLPRFVSSYLVSLDGVATKMAAVFSVVAIIGIIAIIPQLIEKIVDVTSAMGGWDEAAKKAYNDIIEKNREAYFAALKTSEEERKMTEIGLVGLVKKQREQENTTATLKQYNNELGGSLRAHTTIGTQLDALKNKSWFTRGSGILWAQEVEKIQTAYDNTGKSVDELFNKVKELTLAEERLKREIAEQKFADYSAQARAMADAIKTVSMTALTFQEQSAHEMYELGLINHEQEIAALKTAENEKFEVEKASIAKRKALAVAEEKATGKPAGPELTKLEAERESLSITHQSKLSAIYTAGEMERRRVDDAASLAEVTGAERVANAKVQLEVQTARELRASRVITASEEASRLRAAENDRYTAERAAVTKELELAKQYPEKNKAQIIAMQHDLEAMEISHKAKLQAIDATAAEEALSEDRRRMMEEIRYAEESANVQLQITRSNIDTMLKTHQIGSSRWLTMQVKAINDWYNAERAVLEKELAQAKKVYGEHAIEYKKLMDKLRMLDQQRDKEVTVVTNKESEKVKQMAAQIENSLIGMTNRWAAGWETTGQMWKSLWESMTTTLVTNLEKMIVQMIIAAIMHKSLMKTEILGAAKTAAANTYKAVSAIPYVGPFLAPPAAAAAFAAVMAFGSFQRGGITEKETLAHLHPREMVLPEYISSPLIGMLRGLALPSGMATLHGGFGGGPNLPASMASLQRSMNRAGVNRSQGGSVAISIQAWDGDSVNNWLRNGGDSQIAASVKRGYKRGSF